MFRTSTWTDVPPTTYMKSPVRMTSLPMYTMALIWWYMMSTYMHIQVCRTIVVQNLNMDRCTPYHIHEESCKDDLITHVYNGTDMVVYDVNLHAYTGM